MENPVLSGKPVEAFQRWREQRASGGRRPSGAATASEAADKGKKTVKYTSNKSGVVPPSPILHAEEDPPRVQSYTKPRELTGQRRQSGSRASKGSTTNATLPARDEGMEAGGTTHFFVQRSTSNSPSNSERKVGSSLGRRCRDSTGSSNKLKRVQFQNQYPSVDPRPSSSKRSHSGVEGGTAEEHRARERDGRDERRSLSTAGGMVRGPVDRRRSCQSPARRELQSNEVEDEDIDLQADRASSIDRPEEQLNGALGCHNDLVVDSSAEETEEEKEVADEFQDEALEDAQYEKDVQAMVVADESRRRRERRQEESMREKEADRRSKEGRPRNFLLVDEYTHKPYGVGVGAWRKELMLLSCSLDPAVGNIIRHPEGAVEEIAEWIKHTWEYSAPLHFEYVKEVIARGVTLRRAELWRKIQAKEPKPEKLSDRPWRTLRKQMQSPAGIKKSESCRRANASRINFGRTGPSGEVGVRQRLRRALRRSPDPEEIQHEMARNKGYGGRCKSQRKNIEIMHGNEVVVKVLGEGDHLSGTCGNSTNNFVADNDDEGNMHGGGTTKSPPMRYGRNKVDEVVREEVLAMSLDDIAQHPLVLKMMQRLASLEGRQSIVPVHNDKASMHEMSIEGEIGDDKNAGGKSESQQMQNGKGICTGGRKLFA